MNKDMTTCICCGKIIPAVKVRCKGKQGTGRTFLQRVCTACNNDKPSGRKYHIPDYCVEGCVDLAGAIVKGVLEEYIRLHHAAVKEYADKDMRLEAFDAFGAYHNSIMRRRIGYYNSLTLGKMSALIESARREEKGNLDENMRASAREIERMLKENQ